MRLLKSTIEGVHYRERRARPLTRIFLTDSKLLNESDGSAEALGFRNYYCVGVSRAAGLFKINKSRRIYARNASV